MGNHRQSRKGQLVIIAALIILILMLALVLSISRINLSIQELEYEPVQETVLGITSDFDRCLTYALSLATHRYNAAGRSLGEASQAGNEFIMKWIDAALNSYPNLGLNVTILNPQSGATDIAWLMDWDSRVGVSCVFAEFRLDVDAYGFKGWMSRSLTAVFLDILMDLIDTNRSIVTVEFQIMERKSESFEPIPNLAIENLTLTLDLILDRKIPVNITSLTHQGNGIYIINGSYISKDSIQPLEILGVTLTVETPGDNILVSASTSGDEWRNIYLAENELVTEPPYIPYGNMFLNPTLSYGQPYRIAVSGNATHNITLSQTIIGTLWLAPTSKSVQLNVTIGFTYNSTDYIIGYDIINATSKVLQPYYLLFNAMRGNYPEGYYLCIPEGSKIFIDITLLQSNPPGVGSIKIYFGYNQKGALYLSGIRLY
jgi:hypothetical protein